MPPFRAGRAGAVHREPIERDHRRALSSILDWAVERLGEGITVDDVARRAAMSPRTLTRRFRGVVGVPPGEWLQRERLR